MTSAKFRRCDAVTARWEGGNVDHPADPGGRTSRGVTQRTYDAYRRTRGQPTQDVYRMSETERADIYQSGYWQPVRGDELPVGVDLATYDPAVNSGPSRGVKWLQTGINKAHGWQVVTVDGRMGPATMSAAWRCPAAEVVKQACAARRGFLQALRTFAVFGRGWMSRVADIEARGVAWALEAGGRDAQPKLQAEARAATEASNKAAQGAKASGTAGAAGGAGGTAAEIPIEALIAVGVFAVLIVGVFVYRNRVERSRARAFDAIAQEAAA